MSYRTYPGQSFDPDFQRFTTELTYRPSEMLAHRIARLGGTVALAAAALLLPIQRARAKTQTLNSQGRILLIRGLDREVAVAKISLPRGKHGVVLSSKGVIDQAEAQKEINANGPAISAGMPVEITRIEFKPHDIVLEINGGGKRRGKWYDHLEVGVGGAPQPVVTQRETSALLGSSITLSFDKKIPDLTVDQVKQLLSSVLDFNRHLPTQLYSPQVSPQFKQAIKKHQVLLGMDRDAVLSSKGPPFRKVRETSANGEETEDWLYGLPPHVLFVTFDGDTVVKIHQY